MHGPTFQSTQQALGMCLMAFCAFAGPGALSYLSPEAAPSRREFVTSTAAAAAEAACASRVVVL